MKIDLWEGFLKGKPHKLVVEDHSQGVTITIEQLTEGPLTVVENVSFSKALPQLSKVMSKYAHDAVKNYMKAKQMPLYMYATTSQERGKYFALVRDMEKHGWKVVKSRLAGSGGQYWEMAKR